MDTTTQDSTGQQPERLTVGLLRQRLRGLPDSMEVWTFQADFGGDFPDYARNQQVRMTRPTKDTDEQPKLALVFGDE